MSVAVDLSGKTAFITGGGTGLGQAMSHRLAQAGAQVVIAAIDLGPAEQTAKQINEAGGEAIAIHVDVSDERSVKQAVQEAEDIFSGGIDILINNAAIYPSKPLEEITTEEWDEVNAVNSRGYFLCAKEVLPGMKKKAWGRIVNISSITHFLGFEHLLHYVSTKGAAIGFTRALAREVGKHGITVNCIAPGAFPTAAEEIHPNREAYNQHVIDQQSLKRRGTPEECADAVLFFCSDLSRFVTGQSLLVDGGWAME